MDAFVLRTKRKRDESERESEDKNKLAKLNKLKWRKLSGENLDCDYIILYSKKEADELLIKCAELLEYNTGQLAKVKVFGKWHDIPRKQVAYGDAGLSYKFSSTIVPARPWIPFLKDIRDKISEVTKHEFNFVLINRYKDGHDHMGEHRDDEEDLVPGHPIASLSLGQPRDFVFRHADSRGKHAKRKIDSISVELQHGSLLMMNNPTNKFWYHSLPQRKRLMNVRINMTFRKMTQLAKREDIFKTKYKDGHDHMGEHRDDEEDLVPGHPIASLSLGQPRDFVFRHADSRGKHAKRKIDSISVELQHGSLLMMNNPTNKYKDGHDHMGEHRDDEEDLVPGHPIASLSLGQPRDFVFRHADSRGKHAKRKIDSISVELQHGSLLMMNNPTNKFCLKVKQK
ncbi:DNA oxidative demethylase ALKBH2-like [Mytilus edulis]|uniref:DNA oxidative demethylase ALKBH2-like n=1 Tax=Mytilus edulis TaxID=6550 RepID=UPI0039F11A29